MARAPQGGLSPAPGIAVNSDTPLTDAALPLEEPVSGSGEAPPAESLLAYPATYALLAVNVVVFLLMLRLGSGPILVAIRNHEWAQLFTAPFDNRTLIRFGASDASMVLGGEWWRLVTAMFVHVTLLHILLNMWCLWNLGLFGEPLLGKQGLFAVYLLTGAAGMIASLGWAVLMTLLTGTPHDIATAGASGAIFGIAGILIILLSNRKLSLPWDELRDLRRMVIFFAVANLVIGIGPDLLARFAKGVPRIDNTAHVGGFVCGLALGLPLFPRMTSARSSYRARQRWTFAVATLVLCLITYAIQAGAKG
ncbi:rhomboid protease GluP [Bryocella elongata]|uniref:Rhomboid protease GluP n=1 Tax=Bryocella elongata TaxID=863522 RepID=A0A1H5ZFZ3_9BACT|nr:rhomboid family intramembrane serine protease [Bryocella elongata]SEG34665.1 rhomboid protease GluP [Bryocella elongata]